MIEKEKIIFQSSISFREFIFRVYMLCGIVGCVIYFKANPMGLSAVIFLILCILIFGGYKKIIIYQDKFLVVQKRIIDKMDSTDTYYYQDIENVEFRPDNIYWINNLIPNRSTMGRKYDKFLIFYKKEGKADSLFIASPRSDMRTAVTLINDHIKKH